MGISHVATEKATPLPFKVFLYSHSFAPNVGGVETYVMLLACDVSTRVTRLVLATKTPAYAFEDNSLPFVVVRRPTLAQLWRRIREADLVQLAGPCLWPMLISLIQKKPVIVEHHGYQACCANGLLLRYPNLIDCTGEFLKTNYSECLRCEASHHSPFHALKQIFLTAIRHRLCKATGVTNIAVTSHVATRLNLPGSKIIHHGVDEVEHSHREAEINSYFTFAYVGRMVTEKGVHVLLLAAKTLRDQNYRFRLKLIGEGPERTRLESYCHAAGLDGTVMFFDFKKGGGLKATLADVDAVVIPSICQETAGLTAIEQMMSARAVVAADIGGLSEIVNDAALRFIPGDALSLADCMRQLIADPSLATQIGTRARRQALARFRKERMVTEHLAVYSKILSRPEPLYEIVG
jgi:glycogen(starch) synthase